MLYRIKVSFIEIYKEEARDLLEFESKELHIREDEKGNTSNDFANHDFNSHETAWYTRFRAEQDQES